MLESAVLCLALNVYYEARGEPLEGQYAVAFVTLNRSRKSGKGICETVFAPKQFSWTSNPYHVPDGKVWLRSIDVANSALARKDSTAGATHFHRDGSSPRWRFNLHFVRQIGNHLFYRNHE